MSRASRTAQIATFVAAFTAEMLPEPVRERTLVMIRDGSAALLAAANPAYSTGKRIAAHVRALGGLPQAGIVGHGFRTNPVQAALANGTMGYACDIEPHHPEAILHPVAVILPTALALAESELTRGVDLVTAVAIGCEVEYRISVAMGPAELYALGFHPSAVCGAFGAAATASYLLGLDAEATERALGLAACQASGLMAWESDPTENARPFQMGVAARSGVTAALLARDGFGGPAEIFDRAHSPLTAFSRNPDPDRLTDRLGESWDGLMEMAIKPYACVSFLHPGLDALLSLTVENDLKPQDIDRLVIRFPKSGVHCIEDNPLKSHSGPYILPVALARRGLCIADIFVDARVADPEIAALCRKVEVVPDEGELEALFPYYYATEIEVRTTDGVSYTRRNDVARGYPEAPMSEAELDAKFTKLVGSVAPERADDLREAIEDLPKVDDVEEYAALMTAAVA